MNTLYTWRDVQQIVDAVVSPPWDEAVADLSEFRVFCPKGKIKLCEAQLKKEFGSAFDLSAQNLELASSASEKRILSVVIGESDETQSFHAKPKIPRPLWTNAFPLEQPTQKPGIPMCAFFSYKGGVGRTTALVAFLGSLLARSIYPKVLVIDADVEAPGLTWLLGPPGADRFSFLDCLSLLQDAANWQQEAIPLIADRIQANRVSLDLRGGRRDVFFLPAIRHIDQVFRLPVTPEQLIRGRGRAWIIGDALSAIGRQLGVDAILIDMRAGITEFSSPFLLDRRFRPILVTSCNQQSVDGTLETLRKTQATQKEIIRPDVIVSLVPPEIGDSLFAEISERIWTEIIGSNYQFDENDQGDLFEAEDWGVTRADFAQDLLHYRDITDLLSNRLPGTDLSKKVDELARKLVPISITPNRVTPPITATPQTIATEAKKLEFAESNSIPGLLPIPSLLKLLDQPGGQLPNNIVLGSKGAGKTFAWGQMLLTKTWSDFGKLLGRGDKIPSSKVFPLLASTAIGDALLTHAKEAEESLLGKKPARMTRQELKDHLETAISPAGPLEFWTRAIAQRLGLPAPEGLTVRDLVSNVEREYGSVVLIIDGLEDAFQVAPDKPLSEPQRKLIRALAQDFSNSLREMSVPALGLVVFLRRDLAASAISQNFSQFEALHRDTILTWSLSDALRLPLWLLQRSGWSLMPSDKIESASYEELRQALIPFWGEKLGGKKEAFTDKWVIAALSDLNLVLQARDVMRLIRFAAEQTLGTWPLTPRAIRDSLPLVSRTKIQELEQEVPAVKPIFDKLRGQPSEKRQVPFLPSDVALGFDEVRFLEQQGLVTRLQDDEKLYMPEIVRHGLGYRVGAPGRAKVVALYRAALARKLS